MAESVEFDLKDKHFQTFPNLRQNLYKYLVDIKTDNNSSQGKKGYKYRNYNSELDLKTAGTDDESSVFINIVELMPFFIDECQRNFININPGFASYCLHLLIRDSQDGLEINLPAVQAVSICRLETFLLKALVKCTNQTDATLSSLKISYFFKNNREISLDFFKEKYEFELKSKLEKLINNILQYPESSNDKQLEDLFIKMQVFIITSYQIDRPDNHVLLKQCRQALNSILSKGDIQKYVLKKRYHRLEYLQKLSATAGGILIFNNQGPEGENQSIRNIFADLKLAKSNTKDFLQEGFDRAFSLKHKATEVMLQLFDINVREKVITFSCPLNQLRELNKFVVLFEIYKKKLEQINTVFEKTAYLTETAQKKFECVIEKINEILKYRCAIESEVIFPHFVYLSELWNSLVLYLNHLVELNKIKDHLDTILSEELENKFNELLKDLADKNRYPERPEVYSLQEVFNLTNQQDTNFNILNRKPFVKDYCALTFALTGGILVNSKLDKKLCEKANFRFGFASIEYAKFAEYNFKAFSQLFHYTLLTNSDLIVLFELDEQVIQQHIKSNRNTRMQANTRSIETQTEMISSDKPTKSQLDYSWNIWDFHRKTIQLANIRKKQTHSTQSNLSFGTRNASSQYQTKSNNTTQN